MIIKNICGNIIYTTSNVSMKQGKGLGEKTGKSFCLIIDTFFVYFYIFTYILTIIGHDFRGSGKNWYI